MSDPNPKEVQELPFQAEVQRLLHLVIHSLYTNREVFLRELIANASDAIDKARFVAITDQAIGQRLGPAEIQISVNKDARTVVIEDNGIGMDRSEIIENLGTIARSGTTEFLERIKAAKDSEAANLIGQFGVGFYSAFIVADRIDVDSVSAQSGEAEAVMWRSSGQGSFVVAKGTRTRPGTTVTIHVNKESDDLLDEVRIESLVRKYSDFVSYPIKVADRVVNQTSALWTRPKADISEEQYNEFFSHVQGGFAAEKPLARIHFSADAPIQYHALLFVPDKAPFDLMYDTKKKGIRLYAKRIFVMDGCEQITPPYLQFLRGVVDSEDLSLNVSREMLQDDRTLETIKKAVVKHTLKMLDDMSRDNPEDYKRFWSEFGRLFRLGVSSDPSNQEAIAKLLRYPSSKTQEGELLSLEQYIERMPSEQKAIYYLTGPNLKSLQNSPHLEVFRSRGVEVLLMADPVDEWVVNSMESFQGRRLESVAHGSVSLDDLPPKAASDDVASKLDADLGPRPDMDGCIAAVKKALGERVKDVRISTRLTDSAACLVSESGDLSPQMERVMRMLDRQVESPKRILEINPDHPFVRNLAQLAAREAEQVTTFSELLLDQAMLAEGELPDPTSLIKRMQQVLTAASVLANSTDR